MFKSILKKLLVIFVLLMIINYLTVPILNGIYLLISKLNSDFTISNTIINTAKYPMIIILLLSIIYKYLGSVLIKKAYFISAISIMCFIFLAICVNVNTTDKKEIVEQHIYKRVVKKWNDVDHIETLAITKTEHTFLGIKYRNRTGGKIGKSIPYRVLEYRIFFKDGTSVNVWDDTNSLYKLHLFVIKKNINIKHKEANIEYANGDLSKLKSILGINTKLDQK